jgi:integrase/recombinase XerC
MRILGTGRKGTRILLLKREVCEALTGWLKKRPQSISTDALFLSGRGNQLNQRQIQYLAEKYFKAAWIKDASVHTFRHTFAVRQLETGIDVKALKELLGLKEKDTIRLYLNWCRTSRPQIFIYRGEPHSWETPV